MPSSSARQTITDVEKQILLQVWKNSNMPPRVKTFSWRLIWRALATGLRASRFSNHIKKECARCGAPESDSHLFFHCSFARAVWFTSSLGLRTDFFDNSCYPSEIIQQILSAPHTVASLHMIMSILWMIWKARNDFLFHKKSWSVKQVLFAASALLAAGKEDDQNSGNAIYHTSENAEALSAPMSGS